MAKMTKQEIMRLVKKEDVRFVRFWFTDIVGQVKSFSITIDELEGAIESGMGFDGSSITGYQDIEELDISPNGDLLAYAVNESGTSKLYVQDTEGGRRRSVDLPLGVLDDLKFSPDGRRLLFTRVIEQLDRRPYSRTELW